MIISIIEGVGYGVAFEIQTIRGPCFQLRPARGAGYYFSDFLGVAPPFFFGFCCAA